MSVALRQGLTNIAPGVPTPFEAYGGTAPYTYVVVSGGAGGSINSTTGLYTAPVTMPVLPSPVVDTVRATDALGATAEAEISVGTPLELVCDIIQRGMGFSAGQVYLWDQKIKIPTDSRIYVAVGMLSCKPFSNNAKLAGSGGALDTLQSTNVQATLSIDVLSRSLAAYYQKEQVLLALNSPYSQRQQGANSFRVFPLPGAFVNISEQDGSAILYRYSINVAVQYFVTNTVATEYFSTFELDDILTDP